MKSLQSIHRSALLARRPVKPVVALVLGIQLISQTAYAVDQDDQTKTTQEAKTERSKPSREPKEPATEEEKQAQLRQAEKALKEAEASMKEAEMKRREAVAQLTSMGSDREWAKNASEEDQEKANSILQEGNALLKESFFSKAIEKYTESLKYWDHPGTHYNMALALLTMDDPITTHHHLERAIAYGPDPLEQDKYDYAVNYLALLKKQVTLVEISCQEPGAEVRFDGKFLFRAPGKEELLVLRDEHQVEATKPGFERTLINKRMDSDEPIKINLKLYRPDELYVYSRPYPLWIPITVTAAGVLVAGAGGLSTYLSKTKYNTFDGDIQDDPDCEFGCEPNGTAQGHRDAGDTFRTLGWIGYAAGGAIFATGVTLWVLDRKNATRITPEEQGEFSFTPIIGPGTAGLVGTGRF